MPNLLPNQVKSSFFRIILEVTSMVQIGIVMGSNSDWEVMQHAAKQLKDLGIDYEARVVSAHRTPDSVSYTHLTLPTKA